jgi:hypothetical protein
MRASGSPLRGLLLRARSFLLLAVFLSAGTSLPSLDALTHHQESGAPEKSRPHVEPAGGCLSHAGHCSLGRNAPGTNANLAESRELRLDSTVGPVRHAHWVSAWASAVPSGIPQPRAPPVRFV